MNLSKKDVYIIVENARSILKEKGSYLCWDKGADYLDDSDKMAIAFIESISNYLSIEIGVDYFQKDGDIFYKK